jgi:tetratricopeptide (TPR) repeat protein
MPSEFVRGALLLALLHGGLVLADPPDVLCARGVARYQAGDLPGAVPLLREALRQAPEHVAAQHHLGLALVRLGEVKEGRRLLVEAARQAGDDARLLLDLGTAYLIEGNPAWAVRVLTRASELAPADGRVRYTLGLAMLGLGEAPGAVEELARARALPGVDSEAAAVQLGLALYRSQRWEESRQVLAQALEGRHSSAASQLMRAAYEAEGIPASIVSAEIATGAAVDSNPLYEHETTAPTALGPIVAGSLVLRPIITDKNLLWGELSGARSFYFGASEGPPDKEVGDASPSELHASVFYARRFAAEERAFHLSLGYTFGLTFLDGPPPLADQNHIFLEQHGAHVALQMFGRGGSRTQVRYALLRSDFADLGRSNWGNELALEHGGTLLGERLRLVGWGLLRYEGAHSADYNTVTPGLGLGASWLGPLGVVLGLRLGYEYRNHLDSGTVTRWSEQRLDHNLAAAVEIGRALPHRLRLRAVYQRLQNFSTVTTFDHSRDLFTLSLLWSTS